MGWDWNVGPLIVASCYITTVFMVAPHRMIDHIRFLTRSLKAAILLFTSSQALAINAVYLESNGGNGNEVALLIQEKDGAPLDYIQAYPTGGQGEPKINGNQAHALASDGKHLFVTNTGDDSITTFRIGRSGKLTLVTKTEALGHNPVSLAVVKDNLIVVNQGSTSPFARSNANIQRFKILQEGTLMALKGSYTYLPNAVPVDIMGTSNGHTFSVTLSGLSQIDHFELQMDGSISLTGSTGGISNPLGGAMGRYNPHKFAVTLADESLPGVSSLYIKPQGITRRIFQDIRPSLLDPCWAVSNASSTWLWTSAFKTRTISLYRWAANGAIDFISDFSPELSGPGGLDLAMSHNDRTLFWLRVNDVNDDQLNIRPYIESFAVNIRQHRGTAGLSLIGKTWLPENWSSSTPGGILSLEVR